MKITIAFITILALISMTGFGKKGSATPTHSRSARSRSPGASSQKFAEKTKFHKALVKVAPMSEIAKPVNILVDAEQIYIVSGAKIYIYSAKDYSFKKVFGKKGEGPGEFKVENNIGLQLSPFHNDLMITTSNKLHFYSKDGKQIKVILNPPNARGVLRFGTNNYLGRSYEDKEGKLAEIINLYDSNFNKVKEIYQRIELKTGDRRIYLFDLEKRIMFKSGKEHIYILNKNEFNIRIYDKNGNFSHALEKDFPFVEITDNDKELLFNYYKFLVKDFMRLKPRLVIPKYYPAIFDFTEIDNKLYVLTWKVVDKKREILVVDLKGKMLLKSFIPHKGPLRGDGISPYCFYNNKLYQLYDNPDTETWELLVHEVK
ncbi:MAG: hypothetical protein PVH61_03630 [Candidatus Aminicenantes bacterium]|jgi:hypothetical protein